MTDTTDTNERLQEALRTGSAEDVARAASAHNRAVSQCSGNGLYQAIAEHVAEGRATDIDSAQFREWLASIDLGGDRTFEKIDDAIDELVARYRESSA